MSAPAPAGPASAAPVSTVTDPTVPNPTAPALGALAAVSVPVRGGPPLTAADRLSLPHGSRLHRCAVRGRWTLLVPERVLFPCPITTDVLGRLDAGTLGEIALAMAEEYEAPPELVLTDIAEILSELVERGHVRRVHA